MFRLSHRSIFYALTLLFIILPQVLSLPLRSLFSTPTQDVILRKKRPALSSSTHLQPITEKGSAVAVDATKAVDILITSSHQERQQEQSAPSSSLSNKPTNALQQREDQDSIGRRRNRAFKALLEAVEWGIIFILIAPGTFPVMGVVLFTCISFARRRFAQNASTNSSENVNRDARDETRTEAIQQGHRDREGVRDRKHDDRDEQTISVLSNAGESHTVR